MGIKIGSPAPEAVVDYWIRGAPWAQAYEVSRASR